MHKTAKTYNGRPSGNTQTAQSSSRSGSVLPLAAVLVVVVFSFAALTVDTGYLALLRAQMQNSADAAAFAAVRELADQDRLSESWVPNETWEAARRAASDVAAQNPVHHESLKLSHNHHNHPDGEIVIGTWGEGQTELTYDDPTTWNAVWIRLHHDDRRNGRIPLFFAPILGVDTGELHVEAAAFLEDDIAGIRVTEYSGNSGTIPFALHIDIYRAMLDRTTGMDDWTYEDEAGISGFSDNTYEADLFPESPAPGGGVTPGNFGTLRLGGNSVSSSRLTDQIKNGLSLEDLAYHGGELTLDPATGSLDLMGDTGVDAGNIANAVETIVGMPRTVFLYDTVNDPGSNAVYRIVGFAGIVILDYNLTTAASRMYIRIQPAYNLDSTFITGETSNSWSVFGSSKLIR